MTAGRVLAWFAGLVLVALYGYQTVTAVGNLIGMSTYLGTILGPAPWILLGVAVATPAIALAVALVAGRRRGAWMRVLLLAAGACVTAAIHLEIMHLIS